jgi:hypothetical protein
MQTLLTTNGQAPATPIVTGQHIAKARVSYSPQQRADDAAAWLEGRVSIKPTVVLAAQTFRVRPALVVEARKQRARANAAAEGAGLPDEAVERIVVEIGPERILRVVDKLTRPPLPFAVAAE